MVQFYFLAIFINLIGGFYFANEVFEKKFPAVKSIVSFFDNSNSKLVFAIIAGITGLFKIISVYDDDIPVVGDLFIAITSFGICLYFLGDTICKNEKTAEKLQIFYTIADKFKILIGITAIILSILHFFFPGVIFI